MPTPFQLWEIAVASAKALEKSAARYTAAGEQVPSHIAEAIKAEKENLTKIYETMSVAEQAAAKAAERGPDFVAGAEGQAARFGERKKGTAIVKAETKPIDIKVEEVKPELLKPVVETAAEKTAREAAEKLAETNQKLADAEAELAAAKRATEEANKATKKAQEETIKAKEETSKAKDETAKAKDETTKAKTDSAKKAEDPADKMKQSANADLDKAAFEQRWKDFKDTLKGKKLAEAEKLERTLGHEEALRVYGDAEKARFIAKNVGRQATGAMGGQIGGTGFRTADIGFAVANAIKGLWPESRPAQALFSLVIGAGLIFGGVEVGPNVLEHLGSLNANSNPKADPPFLDKYLGGFAAYERGKLKITNETRDMEIKTGAPDKGSVTTEKPNGTYSTPYGTFSLPRGPLQ